MPDSCCVYGCSLRRGQRTKYLGIGFFNFPKTLGSRKLWIKAIRRANWNPGPSAKVCGRHFISGRPSSNAKDIDFIPTLHLRGCANTPHQTRKRRERALGR